MPPRRRVLVASIVALGLSTTARLTGSPAEDNPAIELLAFAATGAPAEFAADLFIRIAESPNVSDTARKRELLNDAFMRAYGAQESFKRAAASAPIDSPAGGVTRALATGLDMLTLQLRATAGMVEVDPARAREMFEWIDFYLPRATCRDLLVPVADEYYSTLAAISRRTFGDTPEERGDALRFFELYLWRTHLPSEIPALVKAVKTLELTLVDAGYLEAAIGALTNQIDSDPRGFSSYGLEIVSHMTELADANRNNGVLGETLMRAARKLIAAQISAARCTDSAAETAIAETFNAILRRKELAPTDVPPVTTNDARSARLLGAAVVGVYWRTPDAKRLVDRLQDLRDLAAGPRTMAIKAGPDWQRLALQWLQEVDAWNGAREASEREFFDQRVLLYDQFMNVVLPGTLRERAVQSWIEFLRRSENGRIPRTAWMANVIRLFDRGEPTTIKAMEESGHYLLTMYARAERLLGNVRRDP